MGLLRVGLRVGAIHVLLASLLLPFSMRLIRFVGLERRLRPAVAAPASLEEAMIREPPRRLTAAELETLKREGVVTLRGVLTPEVIPELRRLAWKHTMMPFTGTKYPQKTWLWNGAIRSLLKDSPIGEILASALEFEANDSHTLIADEAPIWSWRFHRNASWRNKWHADARSHSQSLGYMTLWIVLTNSSNPLEFVRWSHLQRERHLIEEDCAHLVPGGQPGFKEYDSSCVDEHINRLDKERDEGPPLWGENLSAGDAYVFGGNVLHAGVQRPYERLAISIRSRIKPIWPECVWWWPAILPRGNDRDFHCAPWIPLPGLEGLPFIPARFWWVFQYMVFEH